MKMRRQMRRWCGRNVSGVAMAATATILGISPAAVNAIVWDNSSGDNAWLTSSNWDVNQVPNLLTPVVFPGTIPLGASTISVTGPAASGSLTFQNSYTIAGLGTLQFSQYINVGSGLTATMNSPLSGSSGCIS